MKYITSFLILGKTTTSATLAFQYAALGHRVVIYDCDPQRSLSAWLLHGKFDENDDYPYDQYVNDSQDNKLGSLDDPKTLVDQIKPIVLQGIRTVPQPAQVVYLAGKKSPHHRSAPIHETKSPWNDRGKVFLVPGHRLINEYDSQFATADALLDMFPDKVILPAIPYHCIIRTANEYDADIVILDLNPSGGWLNTALLMSSHYILVPTIADFFSDEMARNLAQSMLEMRQKCQRFTQRYDFLYPAKKNHFEGTMRYRFPSHRAKIVGYILTRFSLAVGQPAAPVQANGLIGDTLLAAESRWFDRVHARFTDLHTALSEHNLVIHRSIYEQLNRDLCVGKVRDYFALGDRSHEFSLPVIALPLSADFRATVGFAARDQRERLTAFQEIFHTTVHTLINLMAADRTYEQSQQTLNLAFPVIG